jgi:hypothetical protein
LGPILGSQAHTSSLTAHRLASLGSHASVIAFSAHKTLVFIPFTSIIGMEWTKASLIGMDLSNMAQLSFIF